MNSNNIDSVMGDWKHLRSEICRRSLEPFQSVPFVFYAILAILLFGSAGIWYELYIQLVHLTTEIHNFNGVVTAFTSFYLALVGSACHHLILSSTDKSDKVMVSFSIIVGGVSFILLLAFRILYDLDTKYWLLDLIFWLLAVVCTISPIWIWLIANADDPVLKTIAPDAASGGNTDRELMGSLEGYED